MKEGKIPYEPIQEKRFAVSPDAFSRERLKFVMDIKTEIESKLHFRAYLALFGSLSKGKPLDAVRASKSDIDLKIFIDGADLREFHEVALASDSRYAELYKDQARNYGVDVSVAIEPAQLDAMQHWVICYLAEKGYEKRAQLGFDPRSVISDHDIEVLPIWPNSIMKAIKKLDVRRTELEAEGNPAWLDYKNGYGLADKVARFFHLNPGGGLNTYIRSFFVEAIRLSRDERNRYWDEIRLSVANAERNGVIPEEMKGCLPATFEDATAYYGLQGDKS